MRKWSAENHWTALVNIVSKFFFTQNHGTTRSAKCFMCCCSYDVCPFYRVIVACKYLACNETCKVCHINHQYCSAFVCNFAEALKVDFARIC